MWGTIPITIIRSIMLITSLVYIITLITTTSQTLYPPISRSPLPDASFYPKAGIVKLPMTQGVSNIRHIIKWTPTWAMSIRTTMINKLLIMSKVTYNQDNYKNIHTTWTTQATISSFKTGYKTTILITTTSAKPYKMSGKKKESLIAITILILIALILIMDNIMQTTLLASTHTMAIERTPRINLKSPTFPSLI